MSTATAAAPPTRPARDRLAFWRALVGRPVWARPAVALVAAASAFCYAWRASRPVNIEIYYAAAVRSMAMKFSNFVLGAFDPAGTVSTDKLPGAFWVQALSVRVFGVHNWVLVLPQVIEGTLTVLVLYHVVRRLAGDAAGVLAAGILAVSPATVALDRGNIPDTLMILLAVLAADACVTAVITGRRRPILLAGLWIGLAFQAKMLEAWLVLPTVASSYLMAAPGDVAQRVRRASAAVAVAVAVSLSWMTAVTLLPSSFRPYADGSTDNSLFQQVFVYNGFGRLDEASPDQLVDKTIRLGLPASPPPAWDRLLTGSLGRDTGWLLGAAVIALIAGIAARRGEPRRDPVRAGLVLWGTWLIVLAAVFSVSSAINSYYTAALSPAVAALLAIGLVLAWQHRRQARAQLAVGIALLVTAGYGTWLLPGSGTGLPAWLKPALIGLSALSAVSIGAVAAARPAAARSQAAAGRKRPRGSGAAPIALVAVAILVVPVAASASVVFSGLGPFETPFEPAQTTRHATQFFGAGFEVSQALAALEAGNRGKPYLMATQTSVLAAPFIYASGREVLPIGGFTGTIPYPTLNALKLRIQLGDVSTFLQSPTSTDPRLVWIARHCLKITKATGPAPVLPVSVYYCPAAIFLPTGHGS